MGHCRSVDRRRGRLVPLMCFVVVGLWTKATSFVFTASKAWLSLSPSRKIDLACRQQAPAQSSGSRSELYQLLQQREHVLVRPDMYIGPVEPRNETAWVVKGRKIVERVLPLSPGLVQIYNEILVNAIDRQFHSSLSEIRIDVNPKTSEISVWNDGGAIPVEIHESGLYVPSMVFGEFMSGENFNDTGIRFTGGRNGIGAKATNVFSKSFEVTVDDPGTQQRFYQRWTENMAIKGDPGISPLPLEVNQRGSVRVTFKPDLRLFGLRKIDRKHLMMMRSRAFDAAACTSSNVKVTFNNETLRVQGFQEFSKMTLGSDVAVEEVRDQQGRVRAEVAVAFAEQQGFAALGFVNGIRCSRGTHVKHVTDQLTDRIAEMVAQQGAVPRPSDATVKQYLRIIVKVLVDNPDFDSQTKTRLTTTTHKLGFDLILSSKFIETVAELGVLDAVVKAMEASRLRHMRRALASGPPPSIAKLEDAMNAGKRGHSCTLILTEGDSAKALAVAGLATVGRENFGVFPLKGKLLNVRGASDKQIQSNEEIKHLMRILGLRWGQEFEDAEEVAELRYQRVMIFSDQDLDGHHIAGLVINLLATLWPSLLKVQPNFLQRFATPLVKVFPSSSTASTSPEQEFFSQGDFDVWQREQGPDWMKRYRAKYYKGLGTSTRAEALQYFQSMDKHVIQVEWQGAKDLEALEKAFEPHRTDDRKEWIKDYDPAEELDYSQEATSFEDFFDKSFLHFSAFDNVRSIPKLMDGLKPSQRKVLYWAIQQLKSEKKVSQITGLVSSATSYHHGEQALVKVIVNLAQDFVGTNNLNLFEPIGMFGTRLHGRDVHASARYINTKLSPLVPYIFLKEDLDLLPQQLEEGNKIEPRMLLPIFPLVLVNGFSGIGTGWATQGPNFDVLQVVERLMSLIQKKQSDAKLVPSYRGFQGSVTDVNGKWVSKGNWKILEGEDIDEDLLIVEITELPVKAWTDDYIQELEKKAEKQRISMTIFKCRDHDDQSVHLLLNLDPEQFGHRNLELALRRFLRLEKPVTSLMWLFTEAEDQSQSLQFFEDAEMVLEAFYRARRPFYDQRKERMIQQTSHQVRRLENQLRCIQMYQNGVLEPTACYLEDQGFARMTSSWSPRDEASEFEASEDDGSFKYLLDMPIQKFSVSGANHIEKKLTEARMELERLQKLDIDEMWLQDLQTFQEQYHKVKGETKMQRSTLSNEDLGLALGRFRQESRRWARVDVSNEALNFETLTKLTVPELRDRAEELGVGIRGKSNKQDIIDTLLTYSVIGFKEKNWEKLSVLDRKAHLRIRGLSEAGTRRTQIERLCNSRSPPVSFRKLASEMKDEFRYMGVSTIGPVSELEERYSKVMLCKLEEEQALRNLPREQLRELHPKAAANAEVFERLSRCFAMPRLDDLPKSGFWVKMYKPGKEEKCWVNCIRKTRGRLKVRGSCGEQPWSFFKEVAKCFKGEDCEGT